MPACLACFRKSAPRLPQAFLTAVPAMRIEGPERRGRRIRIPLDWHELPPFICAFRAGHQANLQPPSLLVEPAG